MKNIIGVVCVLMGAISWYAPGWNGFLFQASTDVTTGEGRIIAAIFFIGGLILIFMPSEK
jgi:hypothetical protein